MTISTLLKTNKALILSAFLCCSLVILRFIISLEYYYFFLIWNLFLAIIPHAITYFLRKRDYSKMIFGIIFSVWFLFLPNSFYVVTDLIHLRYSNWQLYDGMMILSFAILCLYLGFRSMKQMSEVISKRFTKTTNKPILNIIILFFCSFGIYLGRFLRYNSWNIVDDPIGLLGDCLRFVRYPVEHIQVWLFTLIFGLMLTGLYYIYLILNSSLNATK